MGNPYFAVPALDKLLSSNHEVAAVVTSPDKPQGRGKKLCSPAVADFARDRNLNLIQQDDLSDQNFLTTIKSLAVAVFIVVAFRILPEALFSIPQYGAVNLHASLLPSYRGAAPIQWALINGETQTGLTTFIIQKRIDTGGVLMQEKVAINSDDTADDLSGRMSQVGADLIVKTLDLLESGDYTPLPQDKSKVTRAPKIMPSDGLIDWNKPAQQIVNLIRGLSSKPGAYTTFEGKKLKIYRAQLCDEASSSAQPGEIIQADSDCGLIIQSGAGAVKIREVQLEGKNRLLCCDYLRGCPMKAGQYLG